MSLSNTLHRLKPQLLPLLFGLSLVLGALMLLGADNASIRIAYDRLEGIAYDFRMRFSISETKTPDPRIVIIDIDEKSLASIGRWPWSRVQIAELVDAIFTNKPAVLGLDILFAEPEIPPLERLQKAFEESAHKLELPKDLLAIAQLSDGDKRLANSFKNRPVVLGYTFNPASKQSTGQLPAPIIKLNESQSLQLQVTDISAYAANIPQLAAASENAGFFLINSDLDGVIRKADMLVKHDNALYPSLALALIHYYYGQPPIDLLVFEENNELVLEGISLDGLLEIPTDNTGQSLIPFHSLSGGFRYLSALDVLQGKVDPSLLEDAIVLVGTTATGLYDLRTTPVSPVFPGVGVHAELLAGMLDQSIPVIATWAQGLDIAVLLLAGLFFGIIFPLLRPGWLILLTLAGIAGYLYFSLWMWQNHQLVISVALPVILIFLLGTGNAAYGFYRENRDRQRLNSMFGQYIPPELVDQMNQQPGTDYGFDGQSRDMTVLFCDIRNFTSISENMAADELKKMLNFFFTPMTETIFNHKGTIDKYVGDMIMAFWGAPVTDAEHNEHAIRSALGMLKQVQQMQPELAARGWPEIAVGIGLNSGKMNVGDMGSSFRRAYTVIGDAVNLGSRLEGLTKFYGVQLCVSESTRAGVNNIIFRPLDTVRVKGKKEGVCIFEPICLLEDADHELWTELAVYDIALEYYYDQDWLQAMQLMTELSSAYPQQKVYAIYRQRIEELMSMDVPENWDAVYSHTSK